MVELGGYIDGVATAFIDRLLATKPIQAAQYEEAWVVIVHRQIPGAGGDVA